MIKQSNQDDLVGAFDARKEKRPSILVEKRGVKDNGHIIDFAENVVGLIDHRSINILHIWGKNRVRTGHACADFIA